RLASACQDVSDGLRITVEELASASDVGIELYADAIPLEPCVCEVADAAGVDALAIAMGASVDFELCFAVSAAELARCKASFDEAGLACHVIGEATEEK